MQIGPIGGRFGVGPGLTKGPLKGSVRVTLRHLYYRISYAGGSGLVRNLRNAISGSLSTRPSWVSLVGSYALRGQEAIPNSVPSEYFILSIIVQNMLTLRRHSY